ncbi:MAG: SMI1/KNR4 family protein [Polyangiaceae bacterium]|nr:SMI1/KNR4 family protein [Polyangiaceae bacterium]
MRTAAEVRDLLKKLKQRAADEYHATCGHRWRLNPRATEAEVAAFEKQWRIRLPSEYREFLLTLGNGGAGPGFGIDPLGTMQEQAIGRDVLRALKVEFDADLAEEWDEVTEPESWDARKDVMAGAMPIATLGCGDWFRLVISGPHAGEIWFDNRGGDGMPPDPVVDDEGELTFRSWYEAWLDECEARWLK